jgi:hypothetical protein
LVCRVKVDDGKRLHGPVLTAQRQQFEVAASPSVLPSLLSQPYLVQLRLTTPALVACVQGGITRKARSWQRFNPHAFHRLCVVKQQKKLYVQCLINMIIILWVLIHNRPELQSKNS